MTASHRPQWLAWARQLQALSQTGLAYSDNEFDTGRYIRVAEIAAEIAHAHTGQARDAMLDGFLLQSGYATPKVDVRGAVVRDGRILLVQESEDERWCMPGGWADVGEQPSEVAVREAWEESGMLVTTTKVVGVYDANRQPPLGFYHAYKIVFLCTIVGGECRVSGETLAVDFFPFTELPPLSVNRTSKRHLAEVLAHLRDPGRPTAFD